MSNLTRVESMDVDALLAMAEEYGIDLTESGESTGSNRIYTNFTYIPEESGGVRVLTAGWMDNGAAANFLWTDPTDKDASYEEAVFDNFGNVNQLYGFIAHVELQSSLGYFNQDTGKSKVFCSTTGYRKDGQLIKALPGVEPWRQMYDWTNGAIDHRKPVKIVEDLGLVGSQGMSCADCIRCGNSTREVEVDGATKTLDCKVTGRMFYYVTEVARVKKSAPKTPGEAPKVKTETRTIRELLGVPGVMVMVKLPTSTGLKGHYNANNPEENVTGYYSYLMGLRIRNAKKGAAYKNPLMYQTILSIKQPPSSSKSVKNLLHFEESSSFEQQAWKGARDVWNAMKPDSLREVQVLDPARFQVNADQVVAAGGAIPVAAAEVPEGFSLKSAAVLDEEDSPF